MEIGLLPLSHSSLYSYCLPIAPLGFSRMWLLRVGCLLFRWYYWLLLEIKALFIMQSTFYAKLEHLIQNISCWFGLCNLIHGVITCTWCGSNVYCPLCSGIYWYTFSQSGFPDRSSVSKSSQFLSPTDLCLPNLTEDCWMKQRSIFMDGKIRYNLDCNISRQRSNSRCINHVLYCYLQSL